MEEEKKEKCECGCECEKGKCCCSRRGCSCYKAVIAIILFVLTGAVGFLLGRCTSCGLHKMHSCGMMMSQQNPPAK